MAPGAIELPDDVDLDYFDRHDLGRLRRRLRTAVQRFRRERERYLELVLSYIDVSHASAWPQGVLHRHLAAVVPRLLLMLCISWVLRTAAARVQYRTFSFVRWQ